MKTINKTADLRTRATLQMMRDAAAESADRLSALPSLATHQRAEEHENVRRAIESARLLADFVLADPAAVTAATRRTARAVRAAVTTTAALALAENDSTDTALTFAREIGRAAAHTGPRADADYWLAQDPQAAEATSHGTR